MPDTVSSVDQGVIDLPGTVSSVDPGVIDLSGRVMLENEKYMAGIMNYHDFI